MKYLRTLGVILGALALVTLLLYAPNALAAGEPYPGSISRTEQRTLYSATALTGNDTVYSSITNTVNGALVARIADYNSADVFVIGDLGTATGLTVTVQFGVDASNFADADYEYATDSAIATQTYKRILNADGVEYMRVPLAGEIIRVKIEHNGTVTPTIKVLLRNN